MRRVRQRVIIFLFCAFCLCAPTLASNVTLEWDPISAPTLVGYKIYYGTQSRTYLATIPIGTQTTYTFPDGLLLTGQTYYFAVTAYDDSGNESGYSNEVSTAILSCDMDGDGVTGSNDLQALADAILGKTPFSNAYDLNEDASINVLDLQILRDVVAEIRSCP